MSIRGCQKTSAPYLSLMDDPGLERALAAAGNRAELARRLGLSRQAIAKWRRIPADQIIAVEAATGIPRETLRPDLYRREA